MKVDRNFFKDNDVVVSVEYVFKLDGEDAQILSNISSFDEDMLVHHIARILFKTIDYIKEDKK